MKLIHSFFYIPGFTNGPKRLVHDWSDLYWDDIYNKSSEFRQVTQPGNYWADTITAIDINQQIFNLNQQSSKVLITNGLFININPQASRGINGGVISQSLGYSFHYHICAMNCNANIGAYNYIYPNSDIFNNYSATDSTFMNCHCTNSVLFIESNNILHKNLNITHCVGVSRCTYVFRVRSENGTSKFNNLAYCNSTYYLFLHRLNRSTLMKHCNIIKNYNSGEKGLIGIMDEITSLTVIDSIFRRNTCKYMFSADSTSESTSIFISDCYFHGNSFNSFSFGRNITGTTINTAKNPYNLGLYSSAFWKAATSIQCERICQNYNNHLRSLLRIHR
ncbi:hypothetical protein TVAG_268850 [Trichomonas vaginalis G3]|uniref:Right handed beta helix domain-containing protein n=1 Tax=Trichomonas vaginalis (strain ATCC PRA-98 / G3) TaxID=412133 RepID=A2FIX1_TRIV3|nr:hypothetical protein TVAGG3_0473490 [Trichomonas vaginalis G3]EAX95148.1 hypothetical protein TVAG_268850 [Trichomonas vaginalis G3]KAI5515239.1 hypothetical protein TVAGG3_0473490 [Trichomonas vaginalis G3]|eukprot:XP_001308078.1 hypothetical protein [Trichomonas vaginalis G3]